MKSHAKLKAELEARLKQLTERATEIDADLSQTPDEDWGENAVVMADDEVQEGVGQAALAEIRAIRGALAAIREGTYGTCAECGTKIAPARLEALPEATLCLSCA